MTRIALLSLVFGFGIVACGAALAEPAVLETAQMRFSLFPETGRYEILDQQAGVRWQSNPQQARFGVATLGVGGRPQQVALARCEVRRVGEGLEVTFRPLAEQPHAVLLVRLKPAAGGALDFSYQADPALNTESVRLLDEALWTTDAAQGYAVVPVREGLFIPADSGKAFTQRFGTYDYEGCHMAMAGFVNAGAAALLTWDDPYVTLELKSVVTNAPWLQGRQALLPSLSLRKSATTFRLHLLGKGDYVTVAKAYRQIAAEKGWLVKWDEKLKGHPDRAKYFGASNFKLWSTLSRSMNDESTKEERVRVNWTFDEAAQVAEHLKNDLKLDRILFILGGWIHRGYDNQHPDILPTAPECGGDAAFADACKRIRALGYLLSLHDNYQDIYRDSPSWNEEFVNRNADGKLTVGGKWAGGRAYITCAQKAVELAKRPQNLVAVKKLSGADSYFIDTTYAAGLYECFDKTHPMTKLDDLKWKQVISDYAREVFGSFGSECGREWAIPHADFFEGLTGVSGKYYHNLDPGKFGASVVPLFEMVYRDGIAMYGKYGYSPEQAAEYVLHHIAIGRPLHYHSIPQHLYWKTDARPQAEPLQLRPAVAEFKQAAPNRFSMTYRWNVDQAAAGDWRVFVHFTEGADKIRFQNDYAPTPPVSQWAVGEVKHGPFTVTVPEGLTGTFNVWMGLFTAAGLERPPLAEARTGEHRVLVGKLKVSGDRIEFEPAERTPSKPSGDAGLFVRADNGWAAGMHAMDRFVKNTHEILSPLNELTSRVPLTQHQFLTPDRKVQRSVFGSGANAMDVVVNMGTADFRHRTKLGGEVMLPPFGFVVESPAFAAFHARNWNGLSYEKAPLFTLRSLDGKPFSQSKQIRVFHAFGDARVRLDGSVRTVEKEAVVEVR
ncbi:MAG: hypothetical protein HZA90_27815 [Verrucomicrobia bacterium]|nr:hypothetical protein [Verrucomicrobiota bacterium]